MGTEDTEEFASTPGADSEGQSRPIREEKLSVQGYVAIKGTRNGLLLTLEPETPFNELLNALAERLAEAPGFFRGASLSVDTSRRRLRVSERIQLERLLASYQMSVMPLELVKPPREEKAPEPVTILPTQPLPNASIPGITGSEDGAAMPSGIPSGPLREESPATREIRDARESTDTLFLRRTVRSGQAIHHDSTIVVLGDVNPGAEIVAGGDIIVWGVLRGMVHAGYPGNEQALVCALQLAPVQLRIAHLLSRPPEGMDAQQLPEVAGIRNGRIVVETWLNGRPPRK